MSLHEQIFNIQPLISLSLIVKVDLVPTVGTVFKVEGKSGTSSARILPDINDLFLILLLLFLLVLIYEVIWIKSLNGSVCFKLY